MAINRATRRVAPASVETGVLEGAYEGGDEPLDQLISRERAERLWEALGRLKSLDREALDAFYIRGHSLIEIAEMLDVPLGTVKRRLHTARKRLKLALEASVADAQEWTDGQDARLATMTPTSSSSSAPAPATSRPGREPWHGHLARDSLDDSRPRDELRLVPRSSLVCGGCRHCISSFSAKVFVELGEIAPGPSRQQGVVEPGSDHDRQQDDGIEDEADVGTAEDREQSEKHQAEHGRNRGERPGHAPVAGQLFLDRLDTQPEPPQLAPPLVLAQAPARLKIFLLHCRPSFPSSNRGQRTHLEGLFHKPRSALF